MPVKCSELVVWQRAMELTQSIYALTRSIPRDERFGLVQQLRRAAVSVPSNIAESHERRSRADYRRFIAIACGSVAELETQVELAVRLDLVERLVVAKAVSLADEVGRMLRAIERSLREEPGIREVDELSELFSQPSALSPQP